MTRPERALDPRCPTPAADRHAMAAQDFAAGAHPVRKELVLRTDDGRRMLVVAVDDGRQPRLAEAFALAGPAGRRPVQGTTGWRVLHGPEPMGPLAVRLDVRLRSPVPCRIHLLFSARDDLVLRGAIACSHVCLVTERAFAQLEAVGRCGGNALVLPAPPADALQDALAP